MSSLGLLLQKILCNIGMVVVVCNNMWPKLAEKMQWTSATVNSNIIQLKNFPVALMITFTFFLYNLSGILV